MTARTVPPALNAVHAKAAAYVAAGLSVIPIGLDGLKQPAFAVLPRVEDPHHADRMKATWEPYQQRLATADELRKWFGGRAPFAIAVVGGVVSGGAECVDLDDKEIAAAYLAVVAGEEPDLFARLSLEDTPRGVHVWYRCEEIAPNTKLATRPDGRDAKGRPKVKCLIETRGEGGYAVVDGSPLAAHDLKLPYRHRGGPPLTALADITAGERDYLFRTAMSFDREDQSHTRPAPAAAPTGGLTPADDYDLKGPPFDELLADARFDRPGRDEGNVTRPGKERGVSATVGHCRGQRGEPLLKVFTTNWHPFEGGRCYGRSNVLRLTRFNGDGGAMMSALRKQGYGDPLPPRPAAAPAAPARAVPPDSPAMPAAPAAWEDPVPLDAGIKVPPFPVDLFPRRMAQLVRSVAEATNSPPDYPGTFALGIASGCVGASYAVDVKEGYAESSSLYLGVVARKGDGKSPALTILSRPLVEEQSRRRTDKVRERAFIEDDTVEKAVARLNESPRGLLMIRDELSGLFGGFNQYKAGGKGGDRQFFLKAHTGSPISVGRKDPDAEDVFVAHPCLSIVGGIQPRILSRFMVDADDGLFDRFQFSFPDPLPMAGENGLTVPKDLRCDWDQAVREMLSWKMTGEHETPRPYFLELTKEAWAVWVEWTRWLAGAVNGEEFPEELRGPAAKLRGCAVRLGLAFFALRLAYGEDLARELDAESLRRGVELSKYFFGHARRVWRATGRDEVVPGARKILAFAKRWKEPAFTRRDAWRALGSGFSDPDALGPALKLLVQHGFLRYAEQEYAGTGRRGTPKYEKHPSLTDG